MALEANGKGRVSTPLWREFHERSRIVYGAATVGVIALGLASRKWPGVLPGFLGKYPGDVLWAVMVFCLWALVRPNAPTVRLAAYALITSYLDEFSQIYQSSWIHAIRATTIGHLILGSAFSWWDMLSYTVGVAMAALGETTVRRLLLFQNPR